MRFHEPLTLVVTVSFLRTVAALLFINWFRRASPNSPHLVGGTLRWFGMKSIATLSTKELISSRVGMKMAVFDVALVLDG